MTLKILTVVGARPQFIKAAALSRHILRHCQGSVSEAIIHTGQHYDENMSQVFFDQMGIPTPKHRFDIEKGTHGAMTGKMLADIEGVLVQEKPDVMLVYGDTNSTLAGALAAAKMHVPVAHVEAGLRSYNRRMPEEINRVLTDHLAARLYCPTATACQNLQREGIESGVLNSGDIMLDVAQHFTPLAQATSNVLVQVGLEANKYILATIHRAENTDVRQRLGAIFEALRQISAHEKVVLPLHPRTRKIALENGLLDLLQKVTILDPVPFWDMIVLQRNARVILTDSGGVQKEAYFNQKPCITVRDETEWVETLSDGWNKLLPANAREIADAVRQAEQPNMPQTPHYGTGNTAKYIVDDLLRVFR